MKKDRTKSLFDNEDPVEVGAHIVRIAFDTGVDTEFDYSAPERLWPIAVGQRIEAPFGRGNKPTMGFCVAVIESDSSREKRAGTRQFKLKTINKVLDAEPLIDGPLMELARWISAYYVCPLGQVLAAVVPAAVKKGMGVKKEIYVYLAGGEEDCVQNTVGGKQRAILDVLRQAGAVDADSAMARKGLLETAQCTDAPLKQLVRKSLIRTYQKEHVRTSPAVPCGLQSSDVSIQLNADQHYAAQHIADQLNLRQFGVSLLYGVTDSGKTEVYIRAIQCAIEQGRKAIVLLPEIALTAQTVERFRSRFSRLAVLHSQLTGPQRNAEWQRIKAGQADVIVGARSAVFAPVPDLGLIVVDEEHDAGYKQDTTPRYHGRDVAIMRAHFARAHCLLGSATPSLETLHNCRTKKHYTLLRLPHRVMDLPMPEIKLVDMSTAFNGGSGQGVQLISPLLEQHLAEVLARGEQAILLLNRRGYSNFVFCASCRHTLHCHNCDVTLTFHKKPGVQKRETFLGKHMASGYAMCHYCLSKTLVPETCPLCGKRMAMIGVGSQRLAEELAVKFPAARVLRVDTDSMQGGDPERYYQLLSDFAQGQIDILAGTQMLAKGLHFANVTLVGVISADTALALPDFRANERTFQLISQVAGRAGRSEKGGAVIVQTLMPDQPAIRLAMANDFEAFVKAELPHRQRCNLPPFGRMAMIRAKDASFERLEAACQAIRRQVDAVIGREGLNITVRGPVPAAISRIHSFHRMQIILQAPSVEPLSRFFVCFRALPPVRPAVHSAYDIDPINLL
ncbi:MAG: primosomal protein N' [Phycisphaerae bacterium]|nr:primosomal protein N' [Phycisphaerae bacterium]